MSIPFKVTTNPDNGQVYEYICSQGQYSASIYCHSEVLRHCETFGYQYYSAVKFTQAANKAWVKWNDNAPFFLNNMRQTVIASGAAKIFEFIPKLGNEYEFTKYEYQLSDYLILGEIKEVAIQVIDDFVLRLKEIGREYDRMKILAPDTVDRPLISDIYKFFLKSPDEYL